METTETKYQKYLPKDYKSEIAVRWCPGCGNYAILNCLHKALAELNISPHNTAVISGIGCSSRLPYYMNTYGFHTIHGRAAAIATGVKVANPALSVWVATGDGDSLAIGGNHFIHALRRNVDINIILFNNKIYGLTKGQYSPTSARGFISKSSPYGTVEDPFRPAELCFGARGTFFARAIDVDMKTQVEVMVEAARHKGASVVEVLQNCVIFNNGIHNKISDRAWKDDNTVTLKQGEKMIFGKENNKGLVLDGWNLKAVTIGEDG
ncbi:MAG: 2-oxoacid:ferredoxin oxidoreductase subunit beta, partial [Proteiniphilum sp.]|nr:2-oxoacid:ferredoxin oxidoreductase subunit beta [Proteiniphilum sp.]MDD4158411.1 2-oxoacid:ferredoxin oxidoreductase subunit beta [Proteiniphilum sp.]